MSRFDSGQLRMLVLVIALAATTVATNGCGYHSQLAPPPTHDGDNRSAASDSGAERIDSVERVAVVALRNDSPEPWLDRIVTDAIRREFGGRGALSFVNDPEQADIVVRGRIRPLDTRSQSFSRFVAALEYGLTLRLDLEVVLASGDVVRLDSRVLSESDVYLASPDIEVTRKNRLEVLRRLSDVLAIRVADSIELMSHPIPEAATAGAGRKGG